MTTSELTNPDISNYEGKIAHVSPLDLMLCGPNKSSC